ncbi:hypothetical protein LIER_39606 [Lithospermum erythrorhizon]|uniref:Uncharacterized protein n=1 Tax=Lithospermum erythrorhizon TaxID=34254 RepID=A0AAV3QKD1_LITER
MKATEESTSQMDVFKRSRKTPPNKPKNPNTDVEEMDKRVITALPGHEEMAKKEAWRDIQEPEKHGCVRVRAEMAKDFEALLQDMPRIESLDSFSMPSEDAQKANSVVVMGHLLMAHRLSHSSRWVEKNGTLEEFNEK